VGYEKVLENLCWGSWKCPGFFVSRRVRTLNIIIISVWLYGLRNKLRILFRFTHYCTSLSVVDAKLSSCIMRHASGYAWVCLFVFDVLVISVVTCHKSEMIWLEPIEVKRSIDQGPIGHWYSELRTAYCDCECVVIIWFSNGWCIFVWYMLNSYAKWFMSCISGWKRVIRKIIIWSRGWKHSSLPTGRIS